MLSVLGGLALLIGYGYGLRLPVASGWCWRSRLRPARCWGGVVFEWKEFGQRPSYCCRLRPRSSAPAWPAAAAGQAICADLPDGRPVRLFASLWALAVDADLSVLPWTAGHVKATYQVLGFAVGCRGDRDRLASATGTTPPTSAQPRSSCFSTRNSCSGGGTGCPRICSSSRSAASPSLSFSC